MSEFETHSGGVAAADILNSTRPGKILVAGGVNAGKSSVINLLLRSHALDVGVAQQPIAKRVIYEPNELSLSREDEAAHGVETTAVTTRTAMGLEIFELPSNAVGEIEFAYLDLLQNIDLLVWCTIASQAWRLSEQTAMEEIRQTYSGPAILAVTRSDLLRSEVDRSKIEDRLNGTARQVFEDILFVSSGPAMLQEAADDDTAWRHFGGEALSNLTSPYRSAEVHSGSNRAVEALKSAEIIPISPRLGTGRSWSVAPTDESPDMGSEFPPVQRSAPLVQGRVSDQGAATLEKLKHHLGLLPDVLGYAISDLDGGRKIDVQGLFSNEVLLSSLQNMMMAFKSGDQVEENLEELVVFTKSNIFLAVLPKSHPNIAIFVAASRARFTSAALRSIVVKLLGASL